MTNTSSLIEEELRRTNGNLSKVAHVLGLNYHALKERQKTILSRRVGVQTPQGPEPEDFRTLGRVGFQHNVVAVKRQGYPWPERFDAAIADARAKFDTGTHEMFQTTENGWVVQYLIPRLKPAARRKFFSTLEDFA